MSYNLTDTPDLSLISQQNLNKAESILQSYGIDSSYANLVVNLTSMIEYNLRLSILNTMNNLFLFSAKDENAIVELAKNQYNETLLPPSVASGKVIFNANNAGISIPQYTKFTINDNIYSSTFPSESFLYNVGITGAVSNNNVVSLTLNEPCKCSVGTKINVTGLNINEFNGNDIIITGVNGNTIQYKKTVANATASLKSYNINSASISNGVLSIELDSDFIFSIEDNVVITGLEDKFNISGGVVSIDGNVITLNTTSADGVSEVNTGILTMSVLRGIITSNIAIIEIESDEVGLNQNVLSGIVVTINTAIENLSTNGNVDTGGITNGSDQELPFEMQQRIIKASGYIQSYGNDGWFLTKMLDGTIRGVTRIKLLKDTPNIGYVTALFIFDNRSDIVPTANELEQMKEYLTTGDNANLFVTSDRIIVSAPSITLYNVSISNLIPNNTATRDYTKGVIASYFKNLDFFNGELPSENICLNKIKSFPNINGEYVSNIDISFTPLNDISNKSLFVLNIISGI